jgi:alginate O-acetyltransferase complex protein AlgI
MTFNSLSFLLFYPIVVALFFIMPNRKRWFLLLAASYFFYMTWNPVFATLMFFETVVVYTAAITFRKINNDYYKKWILILAVSINLTLLLFFKYYNFFEAELSKLGWITSEAYVLNIILPLGISFYTFHAISYVVDSYRGRVEIERHFGVLLLYIAYFPLLVAGPIARAEHLLPQLNKLTSKEVSDTTCFEYHRTVSGLRLMLLGFVKKIVLADNFAKFVQPVFASPDEFSGLSALVATLAFAMQIYFDFSAYTDIARGASRIFGIELNENFRNPYFAENIQEFWRRWHISLSTWFRDYLYIPLGGNRGSKTQMFINLAVVFVLCGFWHGANWTFLIWGGLHGIYIYAHHLTKKILISKPMLQLKLKNDSAKGMRIFLTFTLVILGWVMFRAESIDKGLLIWNNIILIPYEAINYIYIVVFEGISFSPINAIGLKWIFLLNGKFTLLFLYICPLAVIYFLFQYKIQESNVWKKFNLWGVMYRWSSYLLALSLIYLLADFGNNQFIYFQF